MNEGILRCDAPDFYSTPPNNSCCLCTLGTSCLPSLCLLPSVAAGGEGTTTTYVYAGLELAESAARCLDSVLKLRVV